MSYRRLFSRALVADVTAIIRVRGSVVLITVKEFVNRIYNTGVQCNVNVCPHVAGDKRVGGKANAVDE